MVLPFVLYENKNKAGRCNQEDRGKALTHACGKRCQFRKKAISKAKAPMASVFRARDTNSGANVSSRVRCQCQT